MDAAKQQRHQRMASFAHQQNMAIIALHARIGARIDWRAERAAKTENKRYRAKKASGGLCASFAAENARRRIFARVSAAAANEA